MARGAQVAASEARICQVQAPFGVLLPQEILRAITAGRSWRSARLLVASTPAHHCHRLRAPSHRGRSLSVWSPDARAGASMHEVSSDTTAGTPPSLPGLSRIAGIADRLSEIFQDVRPALRLFDRGAQAFAAFPVPLEMAVF